MTQTSNRVLDEFAKLMTDAAGVAQGMKREVETAVRSQAERFLGDMNLVQREEFEAVRDMATRAREENEALRRRIADLEAQLSDSGSQEDQTAADRSALDPSGESAKLHGRKGTGYGAASAQGGDV
jgi:BMFP domain-containing protein YqiC